MRLCYVLLLGLATACGCGIDPRPEDAPWHLLAYGAPALTGFAETRFAPAWVAGGSWLVGSESAFWQPSSRASSKVSGTRFIAKREKG